MSQHVIYKNILNNIGFRIYDKSVFRIYYKNKKMYYINCHI